MMKKLRVLIMGLGNRGTVCTHEMAKHPDRFALVGVAAPDECFHRYHIENK